MNVQEFLREHHTSYQVIEHSSACGAQRMAEAAHVSGDMVAKTVLLKAGRGFCYYLALVPASARVDLEKLRGVMGAVDIDLASEHELSALCRDCDAGVIPPFGSQIGCETIVDESLTWAEEIVFEGNSHQQAIRMKYVDFYNLEHPLVVQISTHA